MKKLKSDYLFFLVLFGLYIKYVPSWTKEWFDIDSFYSFFPFLIIFLFQFFNRKSEELKQTQIMPSNYGLIILLTGGLIYYIGLKSETELICGLSLPFFLSGSILFLYGKRILVLLAPIITLISLSVPIFPIFRITAPLQIFYAKTATNILSLLNINAHSVGSKVFIENYLVTVEAGCTGIKSVCSLIVIVFLLFYFRKISKFKKFLVVVSALSVSFIANIIRILFINFYVFYNGTIGAENFHNYAGFVIFVISLLIILFMNEFIEDEKNVNCKELSVN